MLKSALCVTGTLIHLCFTHDCKVFYIKFHVTSGFTLHREDLLSTDPVVPHSADMTPKPRAITADELIFHAMDDTAYLLNLKVIALGDSR